MDAAFAVEVRVFQEALSATSCFGTGFCRISCLGNYAVVMFLLFSTSHFCLISFVRRG